MMFVSLCPSVVCIAQASVVANQPPPLAIVTINFNNAVLATAEAQRDFAALEKKFAPRQEDIKGLDGEVEALKKQLTAGDKAGEVEKALNRKEKQLQSEAEDFRTDSQAESQQIFQAVAQKLYTVLQEYAQRQGYAAVIERGSEAAPIVWYAAGSTDITDRIVKSYDAKFNPATSNLPNTPKPAHPGTQTPSTPQPSVLPPR